jgi:CheY-like chemotaxis protein
MQFALRVNPGKDAQSFLESKLASLSKLDPSMSLTKLDEEIRLIFSGRFDKLKKDSRFSSYFLTPRKNLQGEETSRGATVAGAFDLMTSVYSVSAMNAPDKQAKQAELQKYFSDKLDALEKVFAADTSVFDKYFVRLFMLSTFYSEELQNEKLEQALGRFEEFLEKQDTLLDFFYWLYHFNLLNQERTGLDLKKKSSLSQRLEDQINHGEPLASLGRQIVLCGMLTGSSRRLVEIAGDHQPLDRVKRVLDEVFDSNGGDEQSQGVLDRFQQFYRLEAEKIREALVFKRILFMNAGHKEASVNRKQWIGEIDIATAGRLVELLRVPDARNGRLSDDQQEQQNLYNTLRKQIDEAGKKAAGSETGQDGQSQPGQLDESMLNLLIHRLANPSLLEAQIEKVQADLEKSRRHQKLDLQSNMVKTYNDNIKRLSQCLYYYIEMGTLKNKAVENRARGVLEKVRREVEELEQALSGAGKEKKAEDDAGRESQEQDGDAEKPDGKQNDQESEGEKDKKVNPATIADPVRRAEVLAVQLKGMPDSNKIKPLKELAYTGGLDALKHILPLSQYNSEFLRNLARGTTIKIILRLLRENEETPMLGIQQKKKLIDFVVGLDNRFAYLQTMEISNPVTIQKILDILIREDKDFTARTLADIIVDEDDKVRATAVKLIAEMLDQNEGSLLMKMLNDRNARVRANVIESLEAIGNRNVLGILMKYKYDKDNRVRANALKAIWNFGHKDIQDSLEEMLVSLDEKMKASAVWLIGEIGQHQKGLKNLLKVVGKDREEIVQRNLKVALKKIARREEGIKILVADDDIKFCKLICARLIHEGFKATAVFNGKALLSALAHAIPDLVLLDLRMPLINGLEALKQMRSDEATAETPVIVMSEVNSAVLLKQIERSGATDYLIKPCNYEQIRAKIKPYV